MEYLHVIGQKMIEIDNERAKRNAQHIVNALAKSLSKGNQQQQAKNQSSTA